MINGWAGGRQTGRVRREEEGEVGSVTSAGLFSVQGVLVVEHWTGACRAPGHRGATCQGHSFSLESVQMLGRKVDT